MSRLKHPHVVIVGGGFAGLNAARGLARASVRVTLIDKRNYHLFRPMLYFGIGIKVTWPSSGALSPLPISDFSASRD
jgi:2-polyprenyl-6-methoxyphenol hydroxylase-like FAD-dependent oxidoreductase